MDGVYHGYCFTKIKFTYCGIQDEISLFKI